MTLYDFVRRTLEAHGPISRGELLNVILADEEAARELAVGQGFTRLLDNMRHSGFISIEGEMVSRTRRKLGRRHV